MSIVSLETLSIERIAGHANPVCEKATRAAIRAQVERLSAPDAVVIVDYQNDIKGFRYELYCIARESGNPSCVVWCRIDDELAAQRHEAMGRPWSSEKVDLFAQLCRQFERPIEKNRWDAPLFTLDASDPTPCAVIAEAMVGRRGTVQPVNATMPQRLRDASYLGNLETICASTISTILDKFREERMERNNKSSWILVVGGWDGESLFRADITGALLADEQGSLLSSELKKAKNSFIRFAQTRTPDQSALQRTFIDFLNGHFGQAAMLAPLPTSKANSSKSSSASVDDDIGI